MSPLKTPFLSIAIAVFLLQLFSFPLKSQDFPPDAPISKIYNTTSPRAGIKGEYFFQQNSCVFYSMDYNFNPNHRYWITNATRINNTIGLEMNASNRWYIGGSISHRLSYVKNQNLATAKVNFSHRGNIKSIQFIKELSYEYIHHFNDPFYITQKDFQTGMAAGLYKTFQLFKRPLGIFPSYKAILNSGLQFDIYKNRKIDFTRLRLDVFYGITDNVYIGVFAMKETEYYTYSSSGGNPPVNIYFRINNIKPVIGLNLNIVLNADKIENYIPGLPFR